MRYDFDLEDRRGKYKKIAIQILITIVEIIVVIFAAYAITHYGLEKMTVSGENMYPTLNEGDVCLINKMSYKLHSIKRNDVVVVQQSGSEHNYYMIERVIGLPGETVMVQNGVVYIDGKELEEKYSFPLMENGGLALEKITLDDNEYFVLSDNRNGGEDSRNASIGNILKKDIVGKAWIKTSPFKFINLINEFENTSSGATS